MDNPLVDLTADRDDVREGYGARRDEDAELKCVRAAEGRAERLCRRKGRGHFPL